MNDMDKRIEKLFESFKKKVEIEKDNSFQIEYYIDEISKFAILSNFVSMQFGIGIMEYLNYLFEYNKEIERRYK